MDELIAAIKKAMEGGAAVGDVAKAIQQASQPVFQVIFDKGHSEATQRAKTRETELETQVTTLTTERDAARQKVTDLQAATPDVKKVTEEFQTEIASLTAKHKQEKAELKAAMVTERQQRARSDLRAGLVGAGVDPDYADVLTQKPEVLSRFRFADTGALEVLAEGKDIPLTAGEGQTPLSLLTTELAAKVPAKFLTSNADRGAGGNSGAGGGSRSAATSFDVIRKQTADKYAGTKTNGVSELAGRMGVPRAGAA